MSAAAGAPAGAASEALSDAELLSAIAEADRGGVGATEAAAAAASALERATQQQRRWHARLRALIDEVVRRHGPPAEE